jgi:hypothetical protein
MQHYLINRLALMWFGCLLAVTVTIPARPADIAVAVHSSCADGGQQTDHC